MRIIRSLDEMTETARGWLAGGTVGFVPIKGKLHAGHQALIRAAHSDCEICVVSLIANVFPGSQHTMIAASAEQEYDIQQLQDGGVDVVFIPQFKELFPANFSSYVTPTGYLAEHLEGGNNTGCIREMATTIMQLFQLVRPDIAYFGQKDAQYIAIIRKMIRDLHIDISLRTLPTVRESDGLAMSIRNSQLSPQEHLAATTLYQALLHAKELIEQGERKAQVIVPALAALLTREPLLSFEYATLCHPETFAEVQQAAPGTLIAVGAQVSTVHLTDNILWLDTGQWQL